MTGCVTFLPVICQRTAGHRVYEFGRYLGQRPQYEAVFEDVGTRKSQRRCRDDEISVEQQVYIERSRREFVFISLAPRHPVDLLDMFVNGQRVIVGVEAHHEIQEIVPIKSDCRILVNAGFDQLAVTAPEFAEAEAQVFFGINIAAEPKVHDCHYSYPGPGRWPRSMMTPTSRAPRIAPGLLTFTLTQATPNSSSTTPAIFSASVSIS